MPEADDVVVDIARHFTALAGRAHCAAVWHAHVLLSVGKVWGMFANLQGSCTERCCFTPGRQHSAQDIVEERWHGCVVPSMLLLLIFTTI
jgi:hypothetical protein